jgi:hypothetical protein
MTKKELLTKIDGKSAIYSNSMFHSEHEKVNNYSISNLREQIEKWNAENPDKPQQKVVVTDSTIEVGSQIWRLAKPAKTGNISVRSSYIMVCGVRMDPKDIDMSTVTENSFKTVHGSTIIYK